ncbi:MAG: helix-turn-helix domain-containing protein [Pseudomonadota bacterium]
MSIKCMTWVWEHSTAKNATLLVELAIADFADDDGRAFPSHAKLAAKARIQPRSVSRAIRELQAMGELAIEHQGNGRGNQSHFVLLMGRSVTTEDDKSTVQDPHTASKKDDKLSGNAPVKGDNLSGEDAVKGDTDGSETALKGDKLCETPPIKGDNSGNGADAKVDNFDTKGGQFRPQRVTNCASHIENRQGTVREPSSARDPKPIDILLSIDGMTEQAAKFLIDHRKKTIGKPLTVRAAELMVPAFDELRDDHSRSPSDVVDVMITRCWMGVKVDWVLNHFGNAAGGPGTGGGGGGPQNRMEAANAGFLANFDRRHGAPTP